MRASIDSLKVKSELAVAGKKYKFYNIKSAAEKIGFNIDRMPFSLRVLLENLLRLEDGSNVTLDSIKSFSRWLKAKTSEEEIQFMPARVLMQDFTGVPAVVDLAAMRDAVKKLGGNPQKINPLIPVDLVIDHSVQVDNFASSEAFKKNTDIEMERNKERYEFLKWGQKAFTNFKVVPPGTGICHQVNLENLARVVWASEIDGELVAYPDTLVGTDSHTTMVNGLAVLGWGVGGIEAEAAMLGQTIPMILPEVIGFKLTGRLKEGMTATDLVLTVTQMLRKRGVVGKFVEFFGSGLENLKLADRATISNMAPEYGATCGFFPVDNETLNYMRLTSRDENLIKLVEVYCKEQGLWRHDDIADPEYTDVLELDLSTVEPSLAGPKRPQDRVSLSKAPESFAKDFPDLAKTNKDFDKRVPVKSKDYNLGHGDVVIAAITSCTNTSNPSVMIAAGLVAKKAAELGLSRKPWVKTSLAPGSKVVTEYLKANKLDKYLDDVGFNLVGYGCTTCIGNSGPLQSEIEESISSNDLVVSSVLSGNRNFEGRVHPLVRANYLASPPLVVIYAIAGSMNIDVTCDPIAQDSKGNNIYMRDLWPSNEEIRNCIESVITPSMFKAKYSDVFEGDESWQKLPTKISDTYEWDKNSTYINNPPYFQNMTKSADSVKDIKDARVLAMFGDSITTDHISPAGNIAKNSPAAKYLANRGVDTKDFNSYGSRRGNDEVMVRGTFANVRIKNALCPGTEGGVTEYFKTGEQMPIYDAAMKYQQDGTDLIIIAGKEYGTGSSRDWAAKGTRLLGVKAVIAESFERIHRSNLVGMGIVPLVFKNGASAKSLMLTGRERFDIPNLANNLKPFNTVTVNMHREDGTVEKLELQLAINTENEVEYIKSGSILHNVIRKLV